MTVAQFNRTHRSWYRFANEDRTTLDRMLGLNKKLHVPLNKENPHFLIMGHNSTGKTQLIIQLLLQIEARNELAIVHDPAREYTPPFYKPQRGDVILNPCDQRMPFWSIGDEVRIPPRLLLWQRPCSPTDITKTLSLLRRRERFSRICSPTIPHRSS